MAGGEDGDEDSDSNRSQRRKNARLPSTCAGPGGKADAQAHIIRGEAHLATRRRGHGGGGDGVDADGGAPDVCAEDSAGCPPGRRLSTPRVDAYHTRGISTAYSKGTWEKAGNWAAVGSSHELLTSSRRRRQRLGPGMRRPHPRRPSSSYIQQHNLSHGGLPRRPSPRRKREE
eukprot:5432271-Prymnesium_polylepis.1